MKRLNGINQELDALQNVEPLTEKELKTPFRDLGIKVVNDLAIDCPAVYEWLRANPGYSLKDYEGLFFPAGRIAWMEKGEMS